MAGSSLPDRDDLDQEPWSRRQARPLAMRLIVCIFRRASGGATSRSHRCRPRLAAKAVGAAAEGQPGRPTVSATATALAPSHMLDRPALYGALAEIEALRLDLPRGPKAHTAAHITGMG